MSNAFEPRFADLLELPDEKARERHFDARNYRWFRIYALVAAALAVGFGLFALAETQWLQLLLPAANLAIIRSLFSAADRPFFERGFRHILTVYLLLQIAFLTSYAPTLALGVEVMRWAAPVLLIPFRFSVIRSIVLYSGLWVASLTPEILPLLGETGDFTAAWILLISLAYALSAFANIATTRSDRDQFMRDFRIEASRHRDRKRMREELDYARQIQLQMLPQGDPKLAELDICGICLPATEVGGDYYEYFAQSGPKLGVVIGDVAGHGVASGLLLSGIRSCLHLLQGEELKPEEVLRRLNRMVRQTNQSRMFISLLYALIDYQAKTIELSSAGHPPMLHYSQTTRRVTEIGRGAPPLGTRLEVRYSTITLDFVAGDVLLMVTDGLHETRDEEDDYYGLDRLALRLKDSSHKSSRDIRESILSDVWNFKGNAEQVDDLTLVVIKAT